jgi:hypothetical protein
MMQCTKDGVGQCGSISRAQDDHGNHNKGEYELERDKRVAKLRELMRPMEQASLSLWVSLTFVVEAWFVVRDGSLVVLLRGKFRQ